MKIDFYKIDNRNDWILESANYHRNWMERTPHRFAYRCLPLTIANQLGWWLKNPVGFWATWNGKPEPDDVTKNINFLFDKDQDYWSTQINCQFGSGIVTWNTPYVIKTDPNTQILVTGITNDWIVGAYPLTGFIETHWMNSSFTMNYKLIDNKAVRFNLLIPLLQIIPVNNLITNIEDCDCTVQQLSNNKEVFDEFIEWKRKRDNFHLNKKLGIVEPNSWQKDYFLGKDIEDHHIKIKQPTIKTPNIK